MTQATVVLDDAPRGTESTGTMHDANGDTGSAETTSQPALSGPVIEAAAEAAAEAVAEAVTENQQTQLLERIADSLSEQNGKLETILQRTEPEPEPEPEAVIAVAVAEAEAEPEPEPQTPPAESDAPPAVETRPRTLWQKLLGSGRRN